MGRFRFVSFASFIVATSVHGQVPGGCTGNGQSSAMNFFQVNTGLPPLAASVTAHIGDTLFYQLQVGVPTGACSATNINAFVTFPDGTSVQFLSGASINSGTTVICPGNSSCVNTNSYKYTVRAQDVGSNFTSIA